MYLINVTVDVGLLSEKYHAQHVNFLNTQFENKVFLIFGRNQSRKNSGLIIAQAQSKDELEQVIQLDPYVIHQCAVYEIEVFSPQKIAEDIHLVKA